MKKMMEKLVYSICVIGVIGLLAGIWNLIKGNGDSAKTGFITFGVGTAVYLLAMAYTWIEKKTGYAKTKEKTQQSTAAAAGPLTILGMVVLLERPLRFEADKPALIKSILNQQTNEFMRAVASTAKIDIKVAGASLDDDAYIYGVCRSAFDGLDSYTDNDEFLQRVATGSFTASDGNRGKHYAFLNRKL